MSTIPVSFLRQGVDLMREQGGADVRMVIQAGAPDSRRYNAPRASEVAVFMPGDDYGKELTSRDCVARTDRRS